MICLIANAKFHPPLTVKIEAVTLGYRGCSISQHRQTLPINEVRHQLQSNRRQPAADGHLFTMRRSLSVTKKRLEIAGPCSDRVGR